MKGPTLEDVCRLAATRGVYVNIGVSKANVGRAPHRITVQVSLPPGIEGPPQAFEMDLHTTNPVLNQQLGVALGDFVERVRPAKMKLVL